MEILFTHPTIELAGISTAPETVPHPEWVVPDDVVEHCAVRWELLQPGKLGIDPMCGTGTIPAVINRLGGQCDANELDAEHCRISEARLPLNTLLRQGDYKTLRTPNFYRGYDYIYTSPPFNNFVGDSLDNGSLAAGFYRMLSDDGFLVIDSAAMVKRDGLECYPAAYTTLYFGYTWFQLVDWVTFQATQTRTGLDTQFTELLFVKKPLDSVALCWQSKRRP